MPYYVPYSLELPQIILIPPANEGVYDVEVGRNLGVSCNLEPNLYYPGIVHFTAYLVRDGEQILIGMKSWVCECMDSIL